jgi:hypothetical protein
MEGFPKGGAWVQTGAEGVAKGVTGVRTHRAGAAMVCDE